MCGINHNEMHCLTRLKINYISKYETNNMTLAELLKDSAYRLTQFKVAQIKALEKSISIKDSGKNPAPYVSCLVRGKPIKLQR